MFFLRRRIDSLRLRPIVLLVAALLVPMLAAAQLRAVKTPITSTWIESFGPGHRFGYCTGTFGPPMMGVPIPLEWEVVFFNDGADPITLTYQDDVRDGFNGNLFALNCPPLVLPPGVTAGDVDCDTGTHVLEVRNIVVEPCDKAVLIFSVEVDAMNSGRQTMCNGGLVTDSSGTISQRTVPALPDHQPDPPDTPSDPLDTCLFDNPMCNIEDRKNIRPWNEMTDLNGGKVLPGDSFHVRKYLDIRFLEPLVTDMQLKMVYGHGDAGGNPLPLPLDIEFVQWIDKPLEPAGAEYRYVGRVLEIRDPDLINPPEVLLPIGDVRDYGTWEAEVSCDAPASAPICMLAIIDQVDFQVAFDDPLTRFAKDATCITPVQPNFSSSTKIVEDADASGDAWPGEVLTFTITIDNSTVCPSELPDCLCSGTQVEIADIVDLTLLEAILPLDGGTLVAPDRIEWNLDEIGGAGRSGSTQEVRFLARVRRDVVETDVICNTATVTAAELKSVADGGLLNCATVPPTRISVSPCMDVVIPPIVLILDKEITSPATGPYLPGIEIEYSITVTNSGTVDATDVRIWDCLHPFWDTSLITVNDGGGVNFGPAPSNCFGDWVAWPVIPILAGNGGSQTFSFRATIPPGLGPGSVITNTASTNHFTDPTARTSPEVQFQVCSAQMTFDKSLPKSQYAEGETIVWTLTVENSGDCDATGAVVTDVLDRTRVSDPTLINDPPGGSHIYDPGTGTITWTLAPVAASAGPTSWTFQSTVTASAGDTVCNEASLTYDGGAPITSSPPGGSCADVVTGCSVPLLAITELWAARPLGTTDVDMSWEVLGGANDGYNVCFVTDPLQIGSTCQSAGTSICAPAVTESCVHTGVTNGPADELFFYQVKGVCSGLEGP